MTFTSVIDHRMQPRDGVLVLTGFGLRIAVDRGHLILEDGIGKQRRNGRFPRVGGEIKRLVVVGHAGSVSLEALRWMHELDIAFVQIGPDGELIASGATNAINDVRVRRGQAIAMHSSIGLESVRELLTEKLRGQSRVLDSMDDGVESQRRVIEALDRLAHATTLQELRLFESRAAAAYWTAWERVPLHFAGRDSNSVPAHWQYLGTRTSLLTLTPRKASSPGNAILNYLYAVLEAEATLAAIAVGCDPAMGIIHVDSRQRNSLACDLMEPVRPVVDMHVLNILRSQTFQRKDFFELRDGNCRLMPELTRPLAATSPYWAREVAPWAEKVAGAFLHVPLQLQPSGALRVAAATRHRTPLTGTNRSRGRKSHLARLTASGLPARCKSCGADLERKDRTYCDECLPKHTTSKLIAARQHQLRLRAIGQDKRSSPEVRAQQSALTKRQNAFHARWKAQHADVPSPSVFRKEIWPGLKNMSLSKLRIATGLSRSACQKIRAGNLVPHPRHWAKFNALAKSYSVSPRIRG